jgi:hypothetical protein
MRSAGLFLNLIALAGSVSVASLEARGQTVAVLSVPLQTTNGEPVSPGAPKTAITPDLKIVPNANAALPSAPTDPVKRAAFNMLETHCARCHQTGALVGRAKPAKNLDNILKLDEMAANRKYVKPGDPDASLIYHVIVRQEMPYDVYQDADFDHPFPQAEDLQALRTWIKGLPEQRPDIVANTDPGATKITAPAVVVSKTEVAKVSAAASTTPKINMARVDAAEVDMEKIDAAKARSPEVEAAAASDRSVARTDTAPRSGVTIVVGAVPSRIEGGEPSLDATLVAPVAKPPVKTALRSIDPSKPEVVGHVPVEDKQRAGKNFEVASLEPETSTFSTPAKKAAASATPSDASVSAEQRAMVLEAQQKLEQLGCFSGALSGIEDSETDQAITRFHDKLSRHDEAPVVTADLVGELEGQTFPICREAAPSSAPERAAKRGTRPDSDEDDEQRHPRRAVQAPEHEHAHKARPEPRAAESHPAPPPPVHKAPPPRPQPHYAKHEPVAPPAPHRVARAAPPSPRYSLREPRSAPREAAPSRSTAGDTISGINGI